MLFILSHYNVVGVKCLVLLKQQILRNVVITDELQQQRHCSHLSDCITTHRGTEFGTVQLCKMPA